LPPLSKNPDERWKVVQALSGDESARALADAREKAWRDEKAYLDEARLEGKLEGRLEGELKKMRSIALNLIRYDMPVSALAMRLD
jgi:hypothetical protein